MMRLMGNVVLVALAPSLDEQTNAAGLYEAHALTPAVTMGRVARVGPKVAEVAVGDMVAFPPDVGDPITIGAHACVLLREPQIAAVIPKREEVSA